MLTDSGWQLSSAVVAASNPTTFTAGTVIASALIANAAPNVAWQVDFTGGATQTNEISIASGGTYVLPPGSGLIFMYEISPGTNLAYAFLVFGATVVTNVFGTAFTSTLGTAGKINIGFNGSTAYEIQNLTGAAITAMAVSTMRLRSFA